MGEYLNFKEKVEALASATPMDLAQIQNQVEGAVVKEELTKHRISVRRDIRQELRNAIKEGKVTQMQVSRALDVRFQHLSNFLHGQIPLPLKTIEEILFLLDGIMKRV